MSWLLDAVILIIIAGSIMEGWKKGFIKTAVGAASGLISIFTAFILCVPASCVFGWADIPESLKIAIAFIVIYLLSKLVLYLMSELLTKLFDVPILRTVNKSLGIMLNIIISILNVIALCFVVNAVFDAAELFGSDIFTSIDRESTILFKFFSSIDVFSYILVK